MKIVILDTETFHFPDTSAWEPFRQFGELVLYPVTDHTDAALIQERCQGADIILTNKTPLSADTLNRMTQLKLICVLATGFNIIDVEAAESRNITVCNVPDYSASCVAQHTIALMLSLCNQTVALNSQVHEGRWTTSRTFSWWDTPVLELDGLVVGIVGLGNIGRRVANVAHALGAKVVAYSRSRKNALDLQGFEWLELEALFETCDIVSLHCPQTAENMQFVNAELLGRMKPTAYLINTARGGLIDEPALRDALQSGTIAGAALDVLSQEPMSKDCPLLGVSNCILTPHVAWSSLPARQRLVSVSIENIQHFLNQTPINEVTVAN